MASKKPDEIFILKRYQFGASYRPKVVMKMEAKLYQKFILSYRFVLIGDE